MKARIPNANNSGNMMKKIQEMQDEMERVQAEVEESEFTASSGGGMVEVICNGSHEIKSIKMKPEIVDPEDIDMLEDMILAAANEALRKAGDKMNQEMEKVSGGMNMPGIPGLGGLGF